MLKILNKSYLKSIKYSAVLLVIISLFFGSLSFANDLSLDRGGVSKTISEKNVNLPSDEVVFVESSNDVVNENFTELENLHKKQQFFLQQLESDLNLARADYLHYKSTVTDNNQYLERLKTESDTLTAQISGLDFEYNSTKKRLLNAKNQLKENENSLIEIYDQIKLREVALAEQKNKLRDYLRLIYTEEDKFLNFDNGDIDALKLLLADGSVSSNMQGVDYIAILNDSAIQLIDKLNTLNVELDNYANQLKVKHENITKINEQIESDISELSMQRIAKEKLLKITNGQQTIYSKMLDESVEREQALKDEVIALSGAVSFVRAKLQSDGDSFNPDDYNYLFTEKSKILFEFNRETLGSGLSNVAWPAAPTRGISAYFHDPSYVGVFGVQHQAIDIPLYQGSALHSAADGVVYKTADNGYGYSYVIIAHSGGLMSVYGHVSDILVTEGQLVSQGSIIALSGGMPGTKGAGYMTTGPHLHFEMLLNGKHVDPLEYLPLSTLSEDHVMALPEKYHDAWLKSVMAITDAVVR